MIDSRYRDFKFDLKNVIASDTSTSRFIIGGVPVSLMDTDPTTVGVITEKR